MWTSFSVRWNSVIVFRNICFFSPRLDISIWNCLVIPTYFNTCTDNRYKHMKSPCVVPDVDLACIRQRKLLTVNWTEERKPALSKPDLHLIKCLCFHFPSSSPSSFLFSSHHAPPLPPPSCPSRLCWRCGVGRPPHPPLDYFTLFWRPGESVFWLYTFQTIVKEKKLMFVLLQWRNAFF